MAGCMAAVFFLLYFLSFYHGLLLLRYPRAAPR
jgi:hypothetical protein